MGVSIVSHGRACCLAIVIPWLQALGGTMCIHDSAHHKYHLCYVLRARTYRPYVGQSVRCFTVLVYSELWPYLAHPFASMWQRSLPYYFGNPLFVVYSTCSVVNPICIFFHLIVNEIHFNFLFISISTFFVVVCSSGISIPNHLYR